jgi:hypothetical protein
VAGNEIVGACTGPWQEHISISNTDTFEVRYNHIHDCVPGTDGKEGLSVKDASSHGKVYGSHVYNLNRVGIYVDAEAEHLFDVEVYQNVVHDIEAIRYRGLRSAVLLRAHVFASSPSLHSLNAEVRATISPWSDSTTQYIAIARFDRPASTPRRTTEGSNSAPSASRASATVKETRLRRHRHLHWPGKAI